MGVRFFGAAVNRLEDPALLTGNGRFLDDLEVPGVLHAAFVRSPHAHARINAINAAPAREMSGVGAVYTLGDLDPERRVLPVVGPAGNLQQFKTSPPLAGDSVHYVGQPVAIVVAESRHLAEDAAFLVDIDYEVLPASVDFRAALAPDAGKAHGDLDGNLIARLRSQFGDAEAVFATAAHVVKETLHTHRGGCHSMECRGVLAQHDTRGRRLEVWSATQMPHSLRRALAQHLRLPHASVRVVAPDVGGGFGPKAVIYPEEYAVPLAAIKLGRPVKWVEDRREHFVATTQQRDQRWELEAAVDANGRMLAVRGRGVFDNGAFVPYGLIVPMTTLGSFPGPYALAAIDLTLDCVYTNLVASTPVRGAGRPEACFLLERLADSVARHLGLGRGEVRRRSFVTSAQMPYATGQKGRDGKTPLAYDSGDYQGCLDKAMALVADFPQRQAVARAAGRYLGLGLSSYIEDTGVGPYEGATVRIEVDGRVVIAAGASTQGQGTRTVMAQIAADAFGVRPEDVVVDLQDTDLFPLGMGAVGSRITATGGAAVHKAAVALREVVLKSAADMLDAGNKFLEIVDGAVHVVGEPEKSVTLAQVAMRHAGTFGTPMPAGVSPDLTATAYSDNKGLAYANGTNVCEVEVDPDTGEVRVLRYVVVHDCGRMINPKLVDGQIQGGVVHGIGNALFERMSVDSSGNPISVNYGEYLLPAAVEMPRIEIHHMETPSPTNPIGVKGAGEGGTIPAAACVIAGIEDALLPLGVRINEHPVSPARLRELIRAAQR